LAICLTNRRVRKTWSS
jgi:hypothetical protein